MNIEFIQSREFEDEKYNRRSTAWFKSIKAILLIAIIICQGCKKLVDINPPVTSITHDNVFLNESTATAILNSFYSSYRSSLDSKNIGLMGDEFALWGGANPTDFAYYTNSHQSNKESLTTSGKEIWEDSYNLIYLANDALVGVNASSSLSTIVKRQLSGEAYFIRAYNYFYLVNLYGDLPLVLTIDADANSKLARSPITKIYEQIVADLIKAQELLNTSYVNGELKPYSVNPERVRPTSWAATALLARVYLYIPDYQKAEAEASKLIQHASLFSLEPLDEVFLKNSREAILQFQPINFGENTREGINFNLLATPQGFSDEKSVYLSSFLTGAFESNDARFSSWVGVYNDGNSYSFPTKYKIGDYNPALTTVSGLSEYSMVLRLGEQYLIRAEARARQNKLADAIDDIDKIRERASLPLIANTYPGISQTNLIDTIFHERQVELFSEWGHRWFDLKRSGKVDEVMNIVCPVKGGVWQAYRKLLPLPFNDLLYGINLSQNPGY
jgi:starch-binding outer membrane protein, SusD/RagB family